MKNRENLLRMHERILESIGEGVIAIDNGGDIIAYNRKAREIFGVSIESEHSHPAGMLVDGDWVIIADTGLGEDDGRLDVNDLKTIGVEACSLKPGDAFIAYGKYNGSLGSGKIVQVTSKRKSFKDTQTIDGVIVDTNMDFENHCVTIKIDDKDYSVGFVWSIGHMVAIDTLSGKVKFFQAKGYTYRREEISTLLQGGKYREKKCLTDDVDIVGKHIYDVHPKNYNQSIVSIFDAIHAGTGGYEHQIKEINGLITRCTLKILPFAAFIRVQDITGIEVLTQQRDDALAELESRVRVKDADSPFSKVSGSSPAIMDTVKLARKAAATDSNILILGESGTGKGLFASCIHHDGKRSKEAFIYVNCASIPFELLESELFGYEGGAFTGSRKEGKPGIFELADKGTIFLDEIGEIPITLQVKLLHVLQDQRFMRVGGTKAIQVDVRIICATNQNLEQMVAEGRFRSDLFYRINVIAIRLPPLRERLEDLSLMIHDMMPAICKRAGTNVKKLSPEALRLIYQYEWPGNIRELENVLERAVSTTETDMITEASLGIRGTLPKASIAQGESLEAIVRFTERQALENALKATSGNRIEAMKILGMKKTLFYKKLKIYKLR